MNLKFDAKLIQKLSARAIKANRFDLQWVTLCDNDDNDCRHTDFGFDVDAWYVKR